jgi:hypothetical protein
MLLVACVTLVVAQVQERSCGAPLTQDGVASFPPALCVVMPRSVSIATIAKRMPSSHVYHVLLRTGWECVLEAGLTRRARSGPCTLQMREACVACCTDLAKLLHHGGAVERLSTCRSRGNLSCIRLFGSAPSLQKGTGWLWQTQEHCAPGQPCAHS